MMTASNPWVLRTDGWAHFIVRENEKFSKSFAEAHTEQLMEQILNATDDVVDFDSLQQD
jgi:hypothetical protein